MPENPVCPCLLYYITENLKISNFPCQAYLRNESRKLAQSGRKLSPGVFPTQKNSDFSVRNFSTVSISRKTCECQEIL